MNVHGNGLWSYDPENKAIYAGDSDTIVVYENGLQFETDGPLIVACVNALAGIDDPAAFMQDAQKWREALSAYQEDESGENLNNLARLDVVMAKHLKGGDA